jgi:FMN phosphatase YigB (HAD superfamily)/DNA-binding XRE family transcriptional regulator
MDEKGLGRQLQAVRQRAGLTQQALCHKAGLSYSTLAKIERGAIKAPSIFTIQSIADALGTTLADVMGDVGNGRDKARQNYKKSKSGVRFVYFDINGCLVHFFHRAFTRIAEDSGASPDLIETAFWHANDDVCRGNMTLKAFNDSFGEQFGLSGFDWLEYYFEAVEPIIEMQELARWAAENYRVGLLSNIMPGQIDAMLQRGLLPSIAYDAVVDSSKIGSIKPQAKIYESALTMAGCSPSEILLVDDSRANIMAAEKLGWKVLWFDDYRPAESTARVRSALEFS